MADLSVTTIIALGLPLFFFSMIGLLDLLQKFGYLKSEKQKRTEKRIAEMHEAVVNSKPVDISACTDILRQVLNMVTQQMGLTTETRTDLDTIKGILRNVDTSVRKLDVQIPRDMVEQMEYIYKAIKHRSNEGRVETLTARMESLTAKVDQVLKTVSSHDCAVKELKELHPSVRFDQGETPAHWCSARELAATVNLVHRDVLEAAKNMKESLGEMKHSFRGDKGAEIDHLLKMVDLMGTLLRRVEGLQDRYKEIYDLLMTEA